jgi:hypothetical protein
MDEQKLDRMTFDEVIKLVDQLIVEERKQIGRWLDFKSWDDAWDSLKQELTETRAAQGLPPPTDEDIHDEIDARRNPEELENLRRELQKGIDSMDRGEGIDAEVVWAELTQRAEQWKAEPPRTAQVFKFVKTLPPEEQAKLRRQLGECW